MVAPTNTDVAATVDDTARFLAGMQPSAGSPLLPLTKDPAWQHHAHFFDAAFGQLEQRQLTKVRAWAEANLPASKQAHAITRETRYFILLVTRF